MDTSRIFASFFIDSFGFQLSAELPQFSTESGKRNFEAAGSAISPPSPTPHQLSSAGMTVYSRYPTLGLNPSRKTIRGIPMSVSARTFFYIQQVEQLIRRRLDECLLAIDITAGQYMVLNLIAHHEPVSSADLARKTMMTAQSMGEFIRALEAKKLIERQSTELNKRTMLISSTAAGRKVLIRCESKIDEAERDFFSCLNGEDVASLRILMSRVRSAQLGKHAKEGDSATPSS